MTLYDDIPADPPAPPSEKEIRDAVLADLGGRNADVLAWLRKRLAVIYRIRREDVGRENAYVSADDARKLIDRMPEFQGKCMNFLGALFKAPGWKPTGNYHTSTTPGSHANKLVCWRWEGE
jgi:hypothetical protein